MKKLDQVVIKAIKDGAEKALRALVAGALAVNPKFVRVMSNTISVAPLSPEGYNIGIQFTLYVPGKEDDTEAPNTQEVRTDSP